MYSVQPVGIKTLTAIVTNFYSEHQCIFFLSDAFMGVIVLVINMFNISIMSYPGFCHMFPFAILRIQALLNENKTTFIFVC